MQILRTYCVPPSWQFRNLIEIALSKVASKYYAPKITFKFRNLVRICSMAVQSGTGQYDFDHSAI